MKVTVFSDANDLALNLSNELKSKLESRDTCIALSGGSTPENVYRQLAVHNDIGGGADIFWGDERMVATNDVESNFGNARRLLFDPCHYPRRLLHPVNTTLSAEQAARLYAQEILQTAKAESAGLPCFDWILLGIGTDGHTASLFPGQDLLVEHDRICGVSRHPQSGQLRVTFTYDLINAAKRVTFVVSGPEKHEILGRVLNKESGLPASRIHSIHGRTEIYADYPAARKL